MKKNIILLIVSLILDEILIMPSIAMAYVDPNTGNLIFQILFPIFTAVTTGYLICKSAIRRKLYACKEWLRNKLQ